jgi:hypothetical protein
MIKIAICLSGEPREFEKTWFSWSKLINHPKLDIDFFIHTWSETTMPGDNSGRRKQEYYDWLVEKIKKEKLDEGDGYVRSLNQYNKYMEDNSGMDLEKYDSKNNYDELYEKLNKYYKPKKLVISEKTDLIKFFYENEIWVVPSMFDAYMNSNYGSVSQWYSTQCSFKLKQDYCKGSPELGALSYKEVAKRKYDICIKSRLDTFCMIQTNDNIDEFIGQVNDLLWSKRFAAYTSWIEIVEGEIRTEFATLIGKDEVMHKIWHNFLQGISRWYHLAANNHHHLFTKYVTHQLKWTKLLLVQRKFLDEFVIVRPEVNLDKLKKLYNKVIKTNENEDKRQLKKYVGDHYRKFATEWKDAPFK